MMESFFGKPASWWLAVHAAMLKAGLDDPFDLAARLHVELPPCFADERNNARQRQLEAENT